MKTKYLLFFSFFIFHFSFSQSWLWSENGKGAFGEVWADAVDGYGNCYYTGQFYWSTDFNTYHITDSGNANNIYNMFLVKSDHNGNILWAKQTVNRANNKDASTDAPWSLSIDNKGNSFITSDFPDTVIIGPDTLINGQRSYGIFSIFVAKYDEGGGVKWAKQAKLANDSGFIISNSVTTDFDGNSYLTGAFVDTIYFDSQKISSPNANTIFPFLVKYDSNGNTKWARQATGNSVYGNGQAITHDQNGNIYITGEFADTINFDTHKLTCMLHSEDFFITKYDSNGNVKWAKQSIIPSYASKGAGSTITIDKDGYIYVAGGFIDTLIFNSDTLKGYQNQNNFFLAKYDSNGNFIWAKQSNSLNNTNWSIQTISTDNHEHIYVSVLGGNSLSNCKTVFGKDTFSIYDTAKYDGVSIILKLDSSGNILCSSLLQGGAYRNCIASDTSGNYVYFGGGTATPMVFGKDTVNPFSIPLNHEQDSLIMYEHVGEWNIFPFIARWEECDITLGVNNITVNTKFNAKVYPNPNNGGFTLSYQLQSGQMGVFSMYNALGQKVAEYNLDANSTAMNINQNSLANGVYLYSIKVNNNVVKQDKVVIMK